MSPVKNVSDRRRLPRIGKIHLGVKATAKGGSGKQYPKAVAWFEVHGDDTTPMEAAAAFLDVYGEKPEEIDVVFISNDPKHLPDPWYKAYGGSTGLVCKGNGETALARWDLARDGQRPPGVEGGTWMTTQTKEPVRLEIPCLAEECPMMQSKKCRIVMNLQVMLPEVRGIGVWQIDTSSYNTIHNILDNVEMLKIALPGGIAGVPLKLRRVPMRVHPEGEAKGKTVHVLELAQPNVTYNELVEARQAVQVKMLEASGEAGPIQGNMLAPPEIVDTETPDNLQEESDVDSDTGEVPMEPEEQAAAEAAAEEVDPQVPEGTPEFETVGDLLNFCWQKHALDKPEVLKYSGLADIDAMVGLNLQHVYVKVMRKLEAAQVGSS